MCNRGAAPNSAWQKEGSRPTPRSAVTSRSICGDQGFCSGRSAVRLGGRRHVYSLSEFGVDELRDIFGELEARLDERST